MKPTAATLTGLVFALTFCCWSSAAAPTPQYQSHPPMRPLPTASDRPMDQGPAYFADPVKGSDENPGTQQAPWKTVTHAAKQLKPGDTLYLRGGTYYERVILKVSGQKDKPITIRSYPGELAVVDGGFREFFESPATAWEPVKGGQSGEFVSVKTYPELGEDSGVVSWHENNPGHQRVRFGPASAGGEELGVKRGYYGSGLFSVAVKVLGNFGDSMVPLHGYVNIPDIPKHYMEAKDGKPLVGAKVLTPVWEGPGLWYDLKTQRIHIRLAPDSGPDAYRGETDPRKLPLVIGGARVAFHVENSKHLRLQDLVIRGTRSRTLNVESCADVDLDHLTLYGGAPALYLQSVDGLRLRHSALRGVCNPWSTRSSEKYHGISCYLLIADSAAPQLANVEIANCELTDNHDGLVLGTVNNLRFHHNFVDNFNDDGMYMSISMPAGQDVQLYQNYITRTFSTLSFEGQQAQAGKLLYVYRNVFDLRQPIGDGQDHPTGRMGGDHGSPIWKPMCFYHNIVLLPAAASRGTYAAGLVNGMQGTQRWLFNNIFHHNQGQPGLAMGKGGGALFTGGNLHWSLGGASASAAEAPKAKGKGNANSAKLPASDVVGNPRFVRLSADWNQPMDLRPQEGGAAVNAGVAVSAEWPDALRDKDQGKPDIGALPLGAQPWRIGIDDRYTCFGELTQK